MGRLTRRWPRCVAPRERPADAMTNTYEATIRLPSGGYETVTVEATSWNHARQLLEMLHGPGRVQNLHQR